MKKRMSIMLLITLLVFGGVIGFFFFKVHMMKQYFKSFKMPPVTITATKVVNRDWQPQLHAVGSLAADESVTITPDIAGKVAKIYFTSGQMIKTGQPLIDLDTSTQQAQLKADQAQLSLAKINYQRDKRLYATRAISKSQFDSTMANLTRAQAAVEGDQAIIQKMHITAPFAGKLGFRQVALGQYIPAGNQGAIVSLFTIDPMLVNFYLPQTDINKIKVGQVISFTTDSFPTKTFIGKITTIDADVNNDNRMFKIQATVANKSGQLRSGIAVNVNIDLPKQPNVIVVPQTALVYSLYGNSVYVVQPDKNGSTKNNPMAGTVKQVFVTIGQAQGENIAINKGLKGNELVVTSGQLKLHSGTNVVVDNTVTPN